jgi:endoplasmic reticulum Man9GlcNAc2 1,2-alpha-mannosidase
VVLAVAHPSSLSRYVRYAWGEDELKPVSHRTQSWGNFGLTILDSLDTLYIMEMDAEFKRVRCSATIMPRGLLD